MPVDSSVGDRMKRFVEGTDRGQSTLFPAMLDDYVGEDNPVRAIDVFVDGLDLFELGFCGVEPEATGRPAYHPATLLKTYIYGYFNRVQSSRRLERECQRNVELVWLTGQDYCGIPQGQRRGDPQSLPRVRSAMPAP
jgi:transposase